MAKQSMSSTIEALRAEIASLHLLLAMERNATVDASHEFIALSKENEGLREIIATLSTPVVKTATKPVKAPYVKPARSAADLAADIAYRARCEAARTEAMRSGNTTLVS